MRHHKRTPSIQREVKVSSCARSSYPAAPPNMTDQYALQETLDARVEFTSDDADGRTQHRINQYIIMEEIGRGSYGAVHIATDQFGNEYVRHKSEDETP